MYVSLCVCGMINVGNNQIFGILALFVSPDI